jgi:Lon protease-like protein
MKRPLFPLSAHILPEGRMALRIFEPRYIRMIKEVCAKDAGFVICMLDSKGDKEENTHIFPTGTYCRVIDFDVLEDGLLGVTIEGINCVSVSNIETERDGLRTADCENVEVWSCDFDIQEISPMNERLREIFDTYEEFRSLYDNVKLDDPLWVINRWLELLPLDAEQKQHFLAQKDCKKLVEYLSELIKY